MGPAAGGGSERSPVGLMVGGSGAARATVREALQTRSGLLLDAADALEALQTLRRRTVDLLFLDADAPGVGRAGLLDAVESLDEPPVTLRLGDAGLPEDERYFDSLPADAGDGVLRRAVERALRHLGALREAQALRRRLQARDGYRRLVGRSGAMERIREDVDRLARLAAPVWIHGSGGAGKKRIARAIHDASDRAAEPFVRVDAALLTESSAADPWEGPLRQAARGTLYVEGVPRLGVPLQVALAERLAAGPACRVLAGADVEPRRAVEDAAVAPELVERLAVEVLPVPDLRDRAEDVPLLAAHFASGISEVNRLPPIQIGAEALECLERYAWPGNVAELRNAIEHAVILSVEGRIRPRDLPERIRDGARSAAPGAGYPHPDSSRVFRDAKREVVGHFERTYLRDLMERHAGNVTAAAEQAGMLRSALQRLLRKYGLKSAQFRRPSRGGAVADVRARAGGPSASDA